MNEYETELTCYNCSKKFVIDKHLRVHDPLCDPLCDPMCGPCNEEDRKYHQKFMNMALEHDPNFKSKILEYIGIQKITLKNLIKHFQEELNAEIFQHNVDISLSIKFLIEYLLKNKIVKLYHNNEEINSFQLTKELYTHLIAEENGVIAHNLSIEI